MHLSVTKQVAWSRRETLHASKAGYSARRLSG